MFPRLYTQRLALREAEKKDAAAIYALRSDPRMTCHTGVVHGALAQSEGYVQRLQKSYAAGEDIFWAIDLQGEAGMIGGICLWDRQKDGSFYLGYELSPGHWGRGYMGEALQAVMAYGFSEEAKETWGAIPALWADPREENQASVRLLERHGFALQRSLIHEDEKGVGHRHLLYAKGAEETGA